MTPLPNMVTIHTSKEKEFKCNFNGFKKKINLALNLELMGLINPKTIDSRTNGLKIWIPNLETNRF
jgi:hypothetical protein